MTPMYRSSLAIVMFAAVLLVSAGALAAPPTYRLTEFGGTTTTPTQTTVVTGLNSLGEVAVTVYNGSSVQAFRSSRNGALIPLSGLSPVCGANSNYVTEGINNLGEILVAIYSP